jgi:phospholipase/carboxylesterase
MPHAYNFVPGSCPSKPPLVLLHGSGGNEHELVRLAAGVAPWSSILAVRGGRFAFFHRFPDRSIDEANIDATERGESTSGLGLCLCVGSALL